MANLLGYAGGQAPTTRQSDAGLLPTPSHRCETGKVELTGITPDRVTTDGHDSYPRAIRTELGKAVRPRTSRYLNNRLGMA